AAVFCRKSGRAGALNGSGLTLGRVGEGRAGVSSSSSEYDRAGSNLGFCRSGSAKIFLPDPVFCAAVRRGDNEREAIDIGEGSAICMSTGESITVLERHSGVRVSFLISLFPFADGDSWDRWLLSVFAG